MKRLSLTFIFLIAFAFIGKLKAESTTQCIEHGHDVNLFNGCALYIYSVESTETISNNIFKFSVKEIDDSLIFKTSGRSGSALRFNNTRQKLGFITGYGNQKGLNVLYDYDVVFFQVQYYYSLLKKKSWALEVLLQPQYNATKYQNNFYGEEKLKGHEFGLNMGFLARKNIVKDFLSSYLLISAGPHYVSGTPERQAAGFIFSDNFFAGISVRVYKSIYVDIRGGFRHISNAGFKNPNKGVNSLIINEGVFLAL
jgi:hypothetical protein